MNRKQNNKKINILIKNNKYFESGMRWYYDKYLGFFWEKKLFIILFIPLFAILFLGIYINFDKFSLKPLIFRVSSYVDTNDETLKVKHLEEKGNKNLNILVAKYLVEKYILASESLTKEDFEENEKFILNNSSSLVYFYYKKRNEILSDENPFLNNEKNKNIQMTVRKIDFALNQNEVPYKAFAVLLKTNNNFPKDHPMNSIEYNIEIDFLIDNIFFINKDYDKLNFLVLKYNKL